MRIDRARAALVTGRQQVEIRDFDIPSIGDHDGLLEVEVNALCGSDVEFFNADLPGYPLPMVIGHEPVGRVVEVGSAAARRWGVEVGDRVVVSSAIRCGECDGCARGEECKIRDSYGTLSPDREPGLWGGIATHMYLAPGSTLIPLSNDVSTAAAGFHNPLANGFEWAGEAGQVRDGSTVAVLGAGPRGLACALVAVLLGAKDVTIIGLESDHSKLALARSLGVHRSAVMTSSNPSELRDIVGTDADVVVDTTPHTTSTVVQALAALIKGGRLVIAGIKGPGQSIDLEIDQIVNRRLTLVGPLSKTDTSLRRAVKAVNERTIDLDLITSRAYGLSQVQEALVDLSTPDPDRPLQLRIEPHL
ncbi:MULTISPECIES: alcohol dehydrogenase catalytic domain-containing protein [Actinomycetes]|uniref:zinc-dependent alcohol dehydrogenase n=1 Tax=Actinomycetes TaxID=1760 RepID=UPI0009DDC61E|nr:MULTISPECIES: alcohol dehydrogenase catalytic domain-containing protein [Actinomycetes]